MIEGLLIVSFPYSHQFVQKIKNIIPKRKYLRTPGAGINKLGETVGLTDTMVHVNSKNYNFFLLHKEDYIFLYLHKYGVLSE